MTGSSYSLTSAGVTLANAVVTLTFVNPIAAPNLDFSFRRFSIGQSNNMASAQQRVQLNTQVTGFPTLVSATPTRFGRQAGPASVLSGNTTGAAGTTGINASAEGAGAKTVILADTFNVVNGWLFVATPEEVIEMPSGSASGLGMHLPVAVGAGNVANWAFACIWTED